MDSTLACVRPIEYFFESSTFIYPETKCPQCGVDAKYHPSIVNRCNNTISDILNVSNRRTQICPYCIMFIGWHKQSILDYNMSVNNIPTWDTRIVKMKLD